MEHSIGKTIAALRKREGWTQCELAEQLGVSDKAVSKWESNGGYPEVSQLPAISKIFGVSIDYLMTGAQPEQPKATAETEIQMETNREKEGTTMKTRDFIFQIIKDVCLLLLGLGLAASALMGAFLQPSETDGYFEFIQMAFLMAGAALTIIASIRIAETALKRRDEKKGQ